MISIIDFWNTLMQSLKAGTSGYQSQDEFNRDMKAVELSAMSTLASFYAQNIAVQEMLSPFVKTVGAITVKPADWFQMISAGSITHVCYPITPNQRELYATSSIRKPDAGVSYYTLTDSSINWLGAPGDVTYLRMPNFGRISLVPVSTEDDDYLVPSSESDLEWPPRAMNLLLYLMMDRLGLEMKESLAIEYAQLGIQSELTKIQ